MNRISAKMNKVPLVSQFISALEQLSNPELLFKVILLLLFLILDIDL